MAMHRVGLALLAVMISSFATSAKHSAQLSRASRIKAMMLVAPNSTAEICATCVVSQDHLIIAEHKLAEAEVALANAEGKYAAAVSAHTDCVESTGDVTHAEGGAKELAQAKMTSIQVEMTADDPGAAVSAASEGHGLLGLLDAWSDAGFACYNLTAQCASMLAAKNETSMAVIEERARVQTAEEAIPILQEAEVKACAVMRSSFG
jgi:hypothetical protein